MSNTNSLSFDPLLSCSVRLGIPCDCGEHLLKIWSKGDNGGGAGDLELGGWLCSRPQESFFYIISNYFIVALSIMKIFAAVKECVTRAPFLYFIRSWVALSFKVVSQWGIGNTCPDLHFVQYIKAWMSSTDPVSSITNCYRLIVSYTDPVHSFIIS